MDDDNKGNAEVKKNDKPTKKSLPETQKESSASDETKEVIKETDEKTKELEEETEIEVKNDVKQYWNVQQFYVSLKKKIKKTNIFLSYLKSFDFTYRKILISTCSWMKPAGKKLKKKKKKIGAPPGFEPGTSCLWGRRSTNWATEEETFSAEN